MPDIPIPNRTRRAAPASPGASPAGGPAVQLALPGLIPETLAGPVERITFHNPENGFSVLRIKARGHRGLVTVVGHIAAIGIGEFVHASGAWVNDRLHGLQFRADRLRATPPTTLSGIETYLGSGLIPGLGPSGAEKLVRAFGGRVFAAIEQGPQRLREVEGFGESRAQRIAEGWAEQKTIREIMVFLHGHGVGTARAARIYKTYGAEAVRIIAADPYCLVQDIRGIGFAAADTIAHRLGIERTALTRARAGIAHVLSEAADRGHCGLPAAVLLSRAEALLEIPRDLVDRALALETEAGAVVAETAGGRPCLFPAELYRAEQAIADRLRALAAGAPPWPEIDPAEALPRIEGATGLTLAAGQREAVRLALRSKVLVLTGGPGVGKTTVVTVLLGLLRAAGASIALAAPTGRAARRLAEIAGREARTLHRLLEVDPVEGGFRRNAANPLDCDLVVVDEMSMVDVPLMHALLEAVPGRAALLLVGDVDQLPSVGPGQVLADIIASAALPVVRLTEVFRQAAVSRIVVNAHRINQGLPPEPAPPAAPDAPDAPSDFYFIDARSAEDGVGKIVEIVSRRIPRRFGLDPLKDIQVLCPMNRGGLGARSLNIELQRVLNPPGPLRVDRFGWTFGAGDKVMQVENDYDRGVFNGDLGVVARVDLEEGELVVGFDEREVAYAFVELDRLTLAYATTIHKAQGSEYPAVVIPVTGWHRPMLHRNLIYTGVTRGRQLVVLVGERDALESAVADIRTRWRCSRLAELLRAG